MAVGAVEREVRQRLHHLVPLVDPTAIGVEFRVGALNEGLNEDLMIPIGPVLGFVQVDPAPW